MEIRGKWALVTGGAKRLGKGIALSLARSGANVVIHHGHSPEEAARTVDEAQALGVEAIELEADLRQPEAIDGLFDQVETRCGSVAILVNSAASFKRQRIAEISVDDFDGVMALNLRAPWLCMRRAVRSMLNGPGEQGEHGVVINIADLTGVRAWAGYSHHGVSKAGLIQLTKIAARELAPGVRVNCVVPGAILPPPGMRSDDPRWIDKGTAVPLARTGDPGVVGDAVTFLVGNHFVTGTVLMIDGGEHLLGGRPAEAWSDGGAS